MSSEVIARKCLAALALPVVTNNGLIRSIDGPLGNTLLNLCGFNYKNATMDKFLTELKYVGVSEDLLRDQVRFWQDHWQANPIGKMELPILCYYIDGNTKALWSKKYVKQNKVTMLGRVMGCLEQVFIHDNYGRPIYFETYSGHGPVGEYVLSLFEKIEEDLEGPGARLHVSRAIVLMVRIIVYVRCERLLPRINIITSHLWMIINGAHERSAERVDPSGTLMGRRPSEIVRLNLPILKIKGI